MCERFQEKIPPLQPHLTSSGYKPYDLESEGDKEPTLPPMASKKQKTIKSTIKSTKTTSREDEKSTQKQKRIKLEEQGTKKPKKQGDD